MGISYSGIDTHIARSGRKRLTHFDVYHLRSLPFYASSAHLPSSTMRCVITVGPWNSSGTNEHLTAVWLLKVAKAPPFNFCFSLYFCLVWHERRSNGWFACPRRRAKPPSFWLELPLRWTNTSEALPKLEPFLRFLIRAILSVSSHSLWGWPDLNKWTFSPHLISHHYREVCICMSRRSSEIYYKAWGKLVAWQCFVDFGMAFWRMWIFCRCYSSHATQTTIRTQMKRRATYA